MVCGCDENPVVRHNNHNPAISSVVIFPETVGPSDSLVVICTATDPDGDSLVYDWYSLSGTVVRIKGGLPGQIALYNTPQNFQVFYAPDSMYVAAPQDTFGIECAVRDGIGGGDVSGLLLFYVRKNL